MLLVFGLLFFSEGPFGGEEFGQQRAAFLGHHTFDDFAAVVQSGVIEESIEAADGPGFGVGRAEDDAGDAGQDDGAGAHRAGFEGHVEGAPFEPPIGEGGGGLGDRQHFGVGGRVAELFATVVGLGEDFAVAKDDRADGDLVFGRGGLGLADRLHHPRAVGIDRPR